MRKKKEALKKDRSYTASLVLTTINNSFVLEDYLENFQKFGHLDRVQVFVIPDKKTPKATYKHCKDITKRGLKVTCPTLERQHAYLSRVGFPPYLIPYNSDNRRNIGYLMALEAKTDFIISIDDDNFCLADEDFFGGHQIVCEPEVEGKIVNTNTQWFNVCTMLEVDRPTVTYARGFPYWARHQNEKVEYTFGRVSVRINAGLWLKDPDVDGISWLVNPCHSLAFKGKSFILGEKAWSPINTQNTALHREVVASYYFVRMGYSLAGISIDRYGDIFSGYFAQACVRHMGGAIRFGTPIVDHRRNRHNHIKDATKEWACIILLEDLLPWLSKEVKLEGSTYPEVYTSLSYALEDAVERFNGKIWTDATRAYFHQMGYCMRQWVKICKKIG